MQILYSNPASSAIIERLLSESGLLLSKTRRSMKPDNVTCPVYVKYESKLRNYLTDALPDEINIGFQLDAIGNDVATESEIDTDE